MTGRHSPKGPETEAEKARDEEFSPDEIEVTPAMIKGGKDEIAAVWTEFTGPDGGTLWDEVLTRVFRAMTAAHRKSSL